MRFPQIIFSASHQIFTSPASDQLQQQTTYNPFNAAGAFAAPSQPQPTGYLQPQFTVVPPGAQQPTNPFPVQQAMPTGFLQPQATENPFRASTVVSQPTGFSPFGQTGPYSQRRRASTRSRRRMASSERMRTRIIHSRSLGQHLTRSLLHRQMPIYSGLSMAIHIQTLQVQTRCRLHI
jgi:hypothetical protein